MDGFLNWFYSFITTMLGGLWKIISGIFEGIVQVFNLPNYFSQFAAYSKTFTILDWIVSILAFLLVFAIWAIIIILIVLGIRKYIRFRKSIVGNEDLLEKLADMHRDVIRLTKEKEAIMALKLGQTTISSKDIDEIFKQSRDNIEISLKDSSVELADYSAGSGTATQPTAAETAAAETSKRRFYKLFEVDEKYNYYIAPEYNTELSLEQICDTFRNYACSTMGLFYELKTIRLMFAGLSCTKLVLLQGISGTGKTSLPYAMGKFFKNNATIASVQPSWRDRNELFGYFNEFTKKYNETEVLRRIYEASYNDNINIIVLDEMNIARVEYYFAEMLSILEMPDQSEWKLQLVSSVWETDPKKLKNGDLKIPPNVWYIGTANNDDSTFSVSDKVYDRAVVINLDSKGQPFKAPETESLQISYSYIEELYAKAISEHPVTEKMIADISAVDMYIIEKFRVAFGNRILKQIYAFLPVYVATGGDEIEGLDYLFASKILRKFEALNLSLIRDEIDGLIDFLDKTFGDGKMTECTKYLLRLKKMY